MTSQKVLTELFDNREKLNITNPDRKLIYFSAFRSGLFICDENGLK